MVAIASTTMAQGVIDVHSHIITPDFVTVLQQHDAQLDEGFPLPKWNAEQHLRWMKPISSISRPNTF